MKRKMLLIVISLIFVQAAYAGDAVDKLFLIDSRTLLSDNSAELFINRDNSTSAITGGPTVTPGDIIVTMTGITTIHSTTIGSGTSYNEVTAFSAVKILSSQDVDVGPIGPDDSFGSQNIDLYEFLAGPLEAGDVSYFNWATGQIDLNADGTPEYTFVPVAGALNDGKLFGFVYEDASQNYSRENGIQTGITSASDGIVRLILGIIPAKGDFLSVRAPLDLSGFLTVPSATAIDNTNISMDGTILFHNWAPLLFNEDFTGGNGGFSSKTASSAWPVFDNLDFTITAISEVTPGECRMTGGNATVSPAIGSDGKATWTYLYEGTDTGYWITTGGQIGAPSADQPRGHWTHTQHGGAQGSFGFHSGSTDAPKETYIRSIQCADPGWCVQARCAPFKQIFWTGIGVFPFQHFDAALPGVVPYKKTNPNSTFHFYRAMVGDFGENDRPTREASLVDSNPSTCDWLDKLKSAGYSGPPGPYEASSAVFLDSTIDSQFGYKGGQVCDKCPDYYQIEIYQNGDPNNPGEVIYSFAGFLQSGNYQIHPNTGAQCPASPELVPELFQTKSKGQSR